MQGRILGQIGKRSGSGISNINGIIEEYKVASGGNISAGDFVKFIGDINGLDITTSDKVAISTSELYEPLNIFKMDDGKRVACIMYLSGGIYGIMLTFEDSQIKIGTATLLFSSSNFTYYYDTVKLRGDRFLIFHCTSSSSTGGYLKGLEVSATNSTFKVESTTYTSSYHKISLEKAWLTLETDEKIVVCYNPNASSSYTYLYGLVFTKTETSISAGTETILGSSNWSLSNTYDDYPLFGIFINETTCWIANNKRMALLSITGNNISMTRDTTHTITNVGYTDNFSGNALAYVTHINNLIVAITDKIYCFMYNQENSTVTAVGTPYIYGTGGYSKYASFKQGGILIDNKILFAGVYTDWRTSMAESWTRTEVPYNLYLASIDENSGVIDVKVMQNLFSMGEVCFYEKMGYIDIALIPVDDTIITIYNSEETKKQFEYPTPYYRLLNGLSIGRTTKQLETKDDLIGGVANQDGTEGQTIEVWVPNI